MTDALQWVAIFALAGGLIATLWNQVSMHKMVMAMWRLINAKRQNPPE